MLPNLGGSPYWDQGLECEGRARLAVVYTPLIICIHFTQGHEALTYATLVIRVTLPNDPSFVSLATEPLLHEYMLPRAPSPKPTSVFS